MLDRSTPIGAQFAPAIRNAIQLAVGRQPSIRGFRVGLADGFDAPCGAAPDLVGRNADAAAAVVADGQNVAVIGRMCSFPFDDLARCGG